MRIRKKAGSADVVDTLRGSPSGTWGLGALRTFLPSQLAHVAKLPYAWLSERLELLHAAKNARARPWWQGDDADDLGYSSRCVTAGLKRSRIPCRSEDSDPAAVLRESSGADRRRLSALGPHTACVWGRDYPSLLPVTSGTGCPVGLGLRWAAGGGRGTRLSHEYRNLGENSQVGPGSHSDRHVRCAIREKVQCLVQVGQW